MAQSVALAQDNEAARYPIGRLLGEISGISLRPPAASSCARATC